MSQDVTPAAFERQRSALLSLLDDITISESNCPSGARVAVVAYSAYTKYMIRFQDYQRKPQLIEAVKNIALERTSIRRNLGAAMRFVGQNVFKRVRKGLMMRKVAVFFSSGPSEDNSDIVTAMMEYRALKIVPVVISLRGAPEVERAIKVDDTGNSLFTVLGRDVAADLLKTPVGIQSCAPRSRTSRHLNKSTWTWFWCWTAPGRCRPMSTPAASAGLCGGTSGREPTAPESARRPARVAVIQSGTKDPKLEFGLGTYQSSTLMRRHLMRNMTRRGGSSALGKTLDFTLKEVLKAGQTRRRRAVLAVVGTKTASWDQARLDWISSRAYCDGVALFVVTVGKRYDREQVEDLAGRPVAQHLIHLDRLKADEQSYAQRFFRVFLSALSKGINAYPRPSFKEDCNRLKEPDDAPAWEHDDSLIFDRDNG
ncbi:hypothetical protein PFLUV_G00091140 [Perca fluviatilis]|uniref:VWFA domain-containing protein n=1 Tax=Perca fluviatilis TaxID=8168 RepID=A0A6A5FIS1_PERFL|nr:hypothetical protein PFLUV_G00091140 [Perca fluviatilis]